MSSDGEPIAGSALSHARGLLSSAPFSNPLLFPRFRSSDFFPSPPLLLDPNSSPTLLALGETNDTNDGGGGEKGQTAGMSFLRFSR